MQLASASLLTFALATSGLALAATQPAKKSSLPATSPSTTIQSTTVTAPVTAPKTAQAATVSTDASYSTSGSSALPFSLTATFPGGNSQPIGNALGARYRFDPNMAVTGMLVFSNNTDNTEDKTLFGLAGKFQYFLGSADKRARPYGAGTLYIWKPGGDANKPNDNTAFGLAGAVGAEVFFIPEFSAFAETGLFMRTSHVDNSETEVGTFMSAIGVNFNFGL